MNILKRFFKAKEIYLFGIMILLIVVLGIINPRFLSLNNFSNILRSNSILGVVSIGVLLVMLTAGIDISIAAILAAAAVYSGRCMAYLGFGVLPAFAVAMGTGLLLGCCNAFLIGRFKLPPIIVTLGMKNIIEGVIYLTTGGKWVNNTEFPPSLKAFSAMRVFGVSIQIIILILVLLFTWFLLKYTMLGRSIIALGGSYNSAVRMGVKPLRTYMFVYGYAGMMAGIAGMLNTSIVILVNPAAFSGFELQVIAALVVGGVSLSGGKGSVWGTILGVLFMAILVNGMTFAKISTYYQSAITGFIILGAVTIDTISTLRRQARARKVDVSEKEENITEITE